MFFNHQAMVEQSARQMLAMMAEQSRAQAEREAAKQAEKARAAQIANAEAERKKALHAEQLRLEAEEKQKAEEAEKLLTIQRAEAAARLEAERKIAEKAADDQFVLETTHRAMHDCTIGNLEHIPILLQRGGSTWQDFVQFNPLHLAAQHNQCDIIRFLAYNGVALDIRDANHTLPQDLAYQHNSIDAAELLLRLSVAMPRAAARFALIPAFADSPALRLQAMRRAVENIAQLNIPDTEETQYYQHLLNSSITPLQNSIQAAQDRVNAHAFDVNMPLALQHQAVSEAVQALDGLGIANLDEATHYRQLLTIQRDALAALLQAAQDRLTAHNFSIENNLVVRCANINTAIDAIDTLGIQNRSEAGHYRKLLTEIRDALANAIQSAQTRFAAHQFSQQNNLTLRHQAIQNALVNIGNLNIQSLDEAAHYRQLLTDTLTPLTASITAAQNRLDAHQFNNEPVLVLRRQAINAAIANVPALEIADPDERVQYQALLTQAIPEQTLVWSQVRTFPVPKAREYFSLLTLPERQAAARQNRRR